MKENLDSILKFFYKKGTTPRKPRVVEERFPASILFVDIDRVDVESLKKAITPGVKIAHYRGLLKPEMFECGGFWIRETKIDA